MGAHHSAGLISDQLRPVQLGVGVRQGCESAIHATREYIERFKLDSDSKRVLVKVDVRNAFNSVRRDVVLNVIGERCPELYAMAHQAYSSPTPLYIQDSLIESQTGVQQGDPIGPLAFDLAIDSAARSVKSELNVWYLDDGTFAGPAGSVAEDLERLIPALAEIGLELNPQKSEICFIGPSNSTHYQT